MKKYVKVYQYNLPLDNLTKRGREYLFELPKEKITEIILRVDEEETQEMIKKQSQLELRLSPQLTLFG